MKKCKEEFKEFEKQDVKYQEDFKHVGQNIIKVKDKVEKVERQVIVHCNWNFVFMRHLILLFLLCMSRFIQNWSLYEIGWGMNWFDTKTWEQYSKTAKVVAWWGEDLGWNRIELQRWTFIIFINLFPIYWKVLLIKFALLKWWWISSSNNYTLVKTTLTCFLFLSILPCKLLHFIFHSILTLKSLF